MSTALVIILVGLGFVFTFLFWAVNLKDETPEQVEQRMRDNLRELWKKNNVSLLKFKSHEEGQLFLKVVAREGGVGQLPPPYREQVENYIKTSPLTIAQARAELKEVCGKIYQDKYWKTNSHATPKSCVKEWERLEEMSKSDMQQYHHAIKARFDKPWFRMPSDEDFIYCVLDIIVQDEFPDTAKLYKYISSLSDEGIEKLMNIIGNKLERLNG